MPQWRISLITLGFLLCVTVPSHGAPDAGAAARVKARAEELYGRLLEKNARHFRIREDLAPFFVNEEELNAFLVGLAKALDDKGIYTNRLEEQHVTVLDADPSYGFAETKAELAGDWILWINRSIERVDRWKFVDGEWYVNPPPLKNLDFE